MMTVFLIIIFIALSGLAIGTLIAVKVWYSLQFLLVIMISLCFSSFWFGIILGGAIFGWLPILFTKVLIVLCCIGLAFYFFKQLHPSYGYFPYRGWQHWVILGVFFLFVGIDFSIIGLSSWLLLLLLPIFGGMLFIGTILMYRMRGLVRAGPVFVYLPLVLFLFLGFIKLI